MSTATTKTAAAKSTTTPANRVFGRPDPIQLAPINQPPTAPETPNEQDVIYVVSELKKAKAEAKRLYGICDELEAMLFGELGMKPGDVLTLPDGEVVKFIDNFADKNLHFGHGAVRRFEVKFK